MATEQELNSNVANTSGEISGGIPVSTPVGDPIREARQQIFNDLKIDQISFDEFNSELDNEELRGPIIQALVGRLDGWNEETLTAALLEGKLNEVSSEGSGTTSETLQEPLDASLDSNSQVVEPGSDLVQPTQVRVAGTWREGFGGRFSYDTEGFESYEPDQATIDNLGGWDNVKAFFEREQPDVIVYRPSDEFITGQQDAINFDTARPKNLEAIRKEQELESKPFSEWNEDDKTDYFLSKVIDNNIAQGNSVTDQQLEESTVRAEAAEDEESRTGVVGSVKDLLSSGIRAFGSGSARVGADVLGIPEFLNDAVASIIGTPTFSETYGETFLQDAQDYLRGAISRDDFYNQIRFGDEGIVEAFSQGNIEDAVNQLVATTTSSLPIMLGLSSGNVAGLTTTLSMGAGQYNSLQESNPQMETSMKLLNSTLNMYAEMIPEKIGADVVFKPFYDLARRSGVEVAENALGKFLRKYTGQFGVLSPAAVEGITEGSTTVMQNLIAKYSGEDPNRKINDGLADAVVSGAASGAAISTPGKLANSLADRGNREIVRKLSTQNRDIEVLLNDRELNPEVKSAMTEKYLANVNEINTYIEQEIEQKGSLNSEQRAVVNDLEARKARMAQLIDNPQVPETVQEGAQEDIEGINNEIEKIIKDESNQEQPSSEGTEVAVEGTQVAPVGEEGGQSQELVEPKAGSRLFSEPVEGLPAISTSYKQEKGITEPEGQPIRKLDEQRSMRIADAYEAMEHAPNDPEVKKAYEAMATETVDQFDAITNAGYSVEIYEGEGEPYANSQEMLADLRDNKHLYVLPTEKEFGQTPITDAQRAENPLLRDSGKKDIKGKPLLVNDVFRFVHDVFGHGERGNSFGAIGEENAWDVHARMYSPEARRAMTTETRGQNSWVNFGNHLRNEGGVVPKKGQEGFVPVTERPFAEQKLGLLPEEFSQLEETQVVGDVDQATDTVQQNETFSDNEQSEIVNTPEVTALTEVIEQETPAEIEINTEVVSELATPTFFESISNAEVRASRLTELSERLRAAANDQTLGISADPRRQAEESLSFLRDLTEYAVLKIADGTIKTAQAFNDLAKGLGNFSDEVLNKAYYNAKNVAQEYINTNPQRANIDEATGNVLTNIQSTEVDRAKPTTKVTSKDVRSITDGGTRGQIVKSIKAANKDFYATLEKGAKIGARDTKRRATEHSKTVRDILKQYYKGSPLPLTQVMSNNDLKILSNRITTAVNDKGIEDVLTFLDKVTSKAENAKVFNNLKTLKAQAKRIGKSENTPANIREVFERFGALDPVEMFRTESAQAVQDIYGQLSELRSLIRPGQAYKGNIANVAELNTKLKQLTQKLERERFDREQPKLLEHLKDLSRDSGVKFDESDITNFTDYKLAVSDMETAINDAIIHASQFYPEMPTREKTRSRQTNEDFITNNLDLLSEVDLAEYTRDEQNAINSLKDITPEILDQLSDADVVKIAIALPNIINNERLDGIGSAAAKINSYKLAGNKKVTSQVKNALLRVPALGNIVGAVFRKGKSFETAMRNLQSTSQRIDSLFSDTFTKGTFMAQFGIQGYKEGRNVAQRIYEKSQKDFGELVTKDADVKAFMRSNNRGSREIKLGIYAWFNQQETGLTPKQKQQLFDRKMKTLVDMRGKAEANMSYQEVQDRAAYISNLNKAIDEVSDAKSIEELRSKLGAGEIKVYDNSVGLFASLRPEFLANARLYNNVDLDANVENYTPIDYIMFDNVANADLLDTSYDRAFSSTKISGKAGSKSAKDRIIKDGTLPAEGILDLNFITNTFKNYGLQLADIHTQGARMQIHHNLANTALKKATGGINFFGTINTMMTEEMQTNYSYFNSPRAMSTGRKLYRSLITSTYGKALGGVTQAIKQFVPTMTDAIIRTGDVSMLTWYWGNMGKVSEFISDQDIFRRGVQSSQMGSSVANDIDVGEVKGAVLRNVDNILDSHETFVNKVALGPLRFGDVHAARMAWMMYYNQYAKKNGITVDLNGRPDPAAAAYADNMVDISANTSVDSNKAKFTQTAWAKIIFPFSGAAMTSLVNMGVHTSKLITAIQTRDSAGVREQFNAMMANALAVTAFQLVGFGIRHVSYYGVDALANLAINGIDMEDDEEEEKLIEDLKTLVDNYTDKRVERNIQNSTYYVVNDLLHRGLLSQGPAESFSDAVIKPTFQRVTGYNISTYRASDPTEELFNVSGLFGVAPAGMYAMYEKNKGAFQTREEELEAAGYGAYMMADGTYGFEMPEGKRMPDNLRLFNKAINLMSIPAGFGIQDQFFSSITRTMPRLYKDMEELVYKDVPKVSDVLKTTKFDNKFKNLSYRGKSLALSSSEAKLFRKYYDEAYKESYKTYVDTHKEYFGEGPKMQELAIKHLYKKAKEKLIADPKFKEIWELKAKKKK